MKKLLTILENELNIVKGNKGMYGISKDVFINKVWNGLYNEYLKGSITGTIHNELASIQYDADTLLFTRQGYGSLDIVLMRPNNNNINIDLNNVKSINISISENDWIDIHLLSSEHDDDYDNYVSIVIRG